MHFKPKWKPIGLFLSALMNQGMPTNHNVCYLSVCLYFSYAIGHQTIPNNDTHCLPSCPSIWMQYTVFPFVIYLPKQNRDKPHTCIHNLASLIHFKNILETSAALFFKEKRQTLKKEKSTLFLSYAFNVLIIPLLTLTLAVTGLWTWKLICQDPQHPVKKLDFLAFFFLF